jgi:hypothetical protein
MPAATRALPRQSPAGLEARRPDPSPYGDPPSQRTAPPRFWPNVTKLLGAKEGT